MGLSVREVLRLARRTPAVFVCRRASYRFEDPRARKALERRVESFKDEILYNSQLHGEHYGFVGETIRKQREADREEKRIRWLHAREPVPYCCVYFDGTEVESRPPVESSPGEDGEGEGDAPFRLPYGGTAKILDESYDRGGGDGGGSVLDGAEWMKDYEYFDDVRLRGPVHEVHAKPTMAQRRSVDETLSVESGIAVAAEEDDGWTDLYGRPDPTAPIGQVPCGGCGAVLHCNDVGIPGYLPSEIFRDRTAAELQSMVCQRCHFLREYNVALDLRVHPDEYGLLLEKIGPDRALVVLLVDLLDFPCSVWPGMLDIVGRKRPVVVVGNKVDLLPRDSADYLANVESSLKRAIIDSDVRNSNIKHVALVSAKTGFGVEELIDKLHSLWRYRGNVYLIGCTNSGKSTLFNALLRSDYCKVAARDLVKRATVSQWPGTTLNLLKFPILRPSGWRLSMRCRRLEEERRYRKALSGEKAIDASEPAALMGYIGQTFDREKSDDDDDALFSSSWDRNRVEKCGIDESALEYRDSRWCFDTPGVVHPDQILNLLTTEELLATVPRYRLRPRTFWMKRGMTLFVGGLARLDVVESENPLQLTAFASSRLPLTVCRTERAEELYAELSGTSAFVVPSGSAERMKSWPGLKRGARPLSTVGLGRRKSSADVVLSSAGWVAVAGYVGQTSRLSAWTPGAVGIHLRKPPILPYALNLKGVRMGSTPAYKLGSIFNKKKSKK